MEAISADDARRLWLRAQGVLGAPDRRGGVAGLLVRLGAVQLDTISVLARSHELVAYARLGPVGRDAVESAYWGEPPCAFEYWDHAACIVPLELWPWFAARRRRFRERAVWGREAPAEATAGVLDRLRAEGPLTATELGGAKRGGEWWDWSDTKVAVERLLARGEVVCAQRRGWRRVYDLPERVVPGELLAAEPNDAACARALVVHAAARLGVATREDLAEHHRLQTAVVERVLPDTGLVPVEVEGWGRPAWADPTALDTLAAGVRGRHRTTLLSPFDSLVWDRPRTSRMFGFVHRIEAYTPREQRVHGYYAMPLLAGGRLVGRVDPARAGRTLVARRASLTRPSALPHLAAALREAAAWVGCDAVVVEHLDPPALARDLRRALS